MAKGVAKNTRKKRRPNLSNEEKALIMYILTDPKNQGLSNDEIVKIVNKALPINKSLSVSYLKHNLLPDWRKQIKEKNTLDLTPWSLASEVDIAHEALPFVLACYKQAKVEESLSDDYVLRDRRYFGVNQAKWCAKLSAHIKHIPTLLQWSYIYSNRELVCYFLGIKFDTSDLDIIIVSSPAELATGYLTGKIEPVKHGIFKLDRAQSRIKPIDTQGMTNIKRVHNIEVDIEHFLIEDIEHAFLCGNDDFESPSYKDEHFDPQRGRYYEVPQVSPLEDLNYTYEQLRIYLLWLNYLSEGPLFQGLEEPRVRIGPWILSKKKLRILYKLRRWVKTNIVEGKTPVYLLVIDPLLFDSSIKPTELMREVGYTV